MNKGAIEKELLSLERKYWKAIQEKDFESALELTDDPCIVAGAQGVGSIDRATFEKMMKTSRWDLLEFEAADASTWVKRDGRWRCALHTESIAGDAFGRDRKATN